MSRKLWTTVVVLAVGCLVRAGVAHARAGDLTTPSISIPTVDGKPDGKPDPVVERMHRVLMAHAKEFTGGHFLNAHSVLHYGGGTKTVNALLAELSKINGAVLYVRLSKDAGVTRMLVGEKGPCSCSIDHNGWGDAQTISVTIYLGGEGVDLDGLALPAIQGR
jgi:hypothetical protein